MARARISEEAGTQALTEYLVEKSARSLPTAVRYLLQKLMLKAPGYAVEVRVPPYGAVQCIAGQNHRRGTPPNSIEMDATTWLALATGKLSWEQAVEQGVVAHSGVLANLKPYLPLQTI